MRRKVVWGAIGLGVFFFGVLVGVSGGGEGEASGASTVTVTETVEEAADPVVRAPEDCIVALDLASEGFGLSSEGFGLAGELFEAIGSLDVDAMEAASGKLEAKADDMNAWRDKNQAKLAAATTACREAAR